MYKGAVILAWVSCVGSLLGLTFRTEYSEVPTPSNAIRSEVRASTTSGTLVAGNIQLADNLSQPVFWVRVADEWEMQTIPGFDTPIFGFYTISAIGGPFEDWLIGRGINNNKVEGFAYNYVSGELVWSGRISEYESPVATRLTAISDDGFLVGGTGRNELGADQPVLFDLGDTRELQVVPMPEGFTGGWLYSIRNVGDSYVGSGYLFIYDDESQVGTSYPAKWTPDEGMVPLEFNGELRAGNALRLSDDGTKAFGRVFDAAGEKTQPTLWDLEDGNKAEVLPYPVDDEFNMFGEAYGIHPSNGRIFGSIYRDETPDDEVPGTWIGVVWDENRNVRLLSDYIESTYSIDLGEGSLRSADWMPGGGGLYTSISYPDGTIAPTVFSIRPVAAGFRFLRPMGGAYYSEGRAISDDGKTIAGISAGFPHGRIAAWWREGFGWEHFTPIPNATFTPYFLPAQDLTPDGSVVVGRAPSDLGTPIAFKAVDGNVSSLGRLSDEQGSLSRATGVSDDGSIVVGQATLNGGALSAFVHRDDAISALPAPDNAIRSWAYGISGDGKSAVGWSDEANGASSPIVWDLENGSFQVLPLPSGSVGAIIFCVSGDGSVKAGEAYVPVADDFLPVPVLWDEQDMPMLIPTLEGFEYGSIRDITSDGTTMTGQLLTADFFDAKGIIYKASVGTKTIHDFFLEEHNQFLDPAYDPRVIHISSNGKWITGDGEDPYAIGGRLAFRIPIPEKTVESAFGEDTEPVGTSQFVSTWFGLVKNETYPLVYHSSHGWLNMSVWGPDGGYYNDAKLGWVFVDRATYPLMQILGDDGSSTWVWYDRTTMNPRMFFDYSQQKTIPEDGF